jgi:hypothetical protein
MHENDPGESGARQLLSPRMVHSMGIAVGLDIADERLPMVMTVLGELLDLASALDRLDLTDTEPDAGDPRTGWEGSL